jgi:6-phosphogluconolactonase
LSELRFDDVEALGASLVAHTERAAAAAIARRGRFRCALTGGTAARVLYPLLARARVDWRLVDFYYGDERCVPPGHADANHRVAYEALGSTGARFHPVDGEAPPEAAAIAYEAALPALDVVHLGVGPDGHVCSLFPGHRLLEDRGRRVAAILDSPKPPPARVTLTLSALREARSLWFLVTGENKREAVRDSLRNPTSRLPAALAHRAAVESLWFLDHLAASLLSA